MTDKLEFMTILICSVTMTFFALVVIGLCTSSCTMSMQNVMTSGTASDIVDTNPTTEAQPLLTIPTKAL